MKVINFGSGRQREVKGFLPIEILPPIITQMFEVFPAAKIEPSEIDSISGADHLVVHESNFLSHDPWMQALAWTCPPPLFCNTPAMGNLSAIDFCLTINYNLNCVAYSCIWSPRTTCIKTFYRNQLKSQVTTSSHCLLTLDVQFCPLADCHV